MADRCCRGWDAPTGRGRAVTALLLAWGLLAWPTAAPRLPSARPEGAPHRLSFRIPMGPVAVPAVGVASGALAFLGVGVPAGVAGTLLGTTVAALIRAAVLAGRRRRTALETMRAVRALAREVHAGADLTSAVAALRESAGPVVSDLLGRLVDAAGGAPTVGSVRKGSARIEAALAASVALSRRVGVPLAGLLDRLAEGLADEQHAAEQRSAAVAGARLSGWVLAGLPAMGILLGVGMGADPVPVLLADGLGGVLLVVGTMLSCAGLLWSARIARVPG